MVPDNFIHNNYSELIKFIISVFIWEKTNFLMLQYKLELPKLCLLKTYEDDIPPFTKMMWVTFAQ